MEDYVNQTKSSGNSRIRFYVYRAIAILDVNKIGGCRQRKNPNSSQSDFKCLDLESPQF